MQMPPRVVSGGLKELSTTGQLLAHHASDGNHREATVVQLLGLHLRELGRVGRLETHRVEAKVTGCMVGFDGPEANLGVLEAEDGEDLKSSKLRVRGSRCCIYLTSYLLCSLV